MDNLHERIEKLSPKRLALLALELQERVEELERRQYEPIAIVGMGCRVPGENKGLDGFWQVLAEGRDVISEIPPERWDAESYYSPEPDTPGRMATRWGGFLEDIAGFDAPFFGIARREANSMDPQQRLLLEVCWEALENAGYCPRKAAGGEVGVFTGITTTDYHSLMMERGEDTITVHTATGSGNNVASGRISYVLALQGPNLSVDTACSSSLLAVHLACQSLRAGECRMALAAGVNALLAPELFIALSKAHALAADGRCKAFDSRADGFARAEGCGVIVLKRLSHALADGDHIHAVIRSTAVNQDGRSSGMTAPNGAAQEAVIRRALQQAGLTPDQVDYVEAHGTGTALGDPIEAHALAATLGFNRDPQHPLMLGSVKTNLGHLEAAAGVIGLIKVVLAFQHETIPQHLHFQSLNPHIDWNEASIQIVAQPTPWRRSSRRRIAGLNSFGLSGTNSHVLLEEPPIRKRAVTANTRPLHLLVSSARTERALTSLQQRLAEYLETGNQALEDVCYTASVGRAHFEYRAAFLGADSESMGKALTTTPAAKGVAVESPQIVFLFPGQGAQYSGMARHLYETQPVFREVLDECARLLQPYLQIGLLDVLWGAEPTLIHQTIYTQPALFAVEYALAKLWMSWGVIPAAVAGHSVGEYVAACVAGVFSLEDGLKLIAERGRLMQKAGGQGGMIAVLADEDRVRPALAGVEDRVAIAVLNSPENTVISGYYPELNHVERALEQDGIRVQRLNVSHAFHSPQMREIESDFERVAASLQINSPKLRIFSSVSGHEVGDELRDPGYWRRQVVYPVRFRSLVQTLEVSGYRNFLEVGPGTTLAALGRECVTASDTNWLPSFRKSQGDWSQMLSSLAQLYVLGVSIDWAAYDQPYACLRVPLPTYPFERERYWFGEQSEPRTPGKHGARENGVNSLLYKLAWEKCNSRQKQQSVAGSWLIVADQGEIAGLLKRKLDEAGARVEAVASPRDASAESWSEFDFVVYLAAENSTPLGGDESARVAAASSLVNNAIEAGQVLIATPSHAKLWIASCGAQPVLSKTDGWNAIHSALWGFGRTFGQEHPEAWGGLIDLDPEQTPAEMADALFSGIADNDGEDEIAFRAGERYVARMARHREVVPATAQLSSDRTYLITGGAGALGLQICSWMVDHGARHFVLVGRRAPSLEAETHLNALRDRGVSVAFRSADVTQRAQLETVFRKIGVEMPPLGGIVHAAGIVEDAVIANVSAEQIARVSGPKIQGAWNLHQLTNGLSLEFFVMFSSLASVTGSAGQAAYAAANAFMDGLARYRASHNLPALCLNWGAWAGDGMAARVEANVRPRGGAFRHVSPQLALEAFGKLLASAAVEIVVADVDWDELGSAAEKRIVRPIFSRMVRSKANATASPVADLSSLTHAKQRPQLITYLQNMLASILGVENEAIMPTRPLVDLGLDSLMALEFRNRMRTDLQVTIPTAKLLAGPTLEGLAAEIAPEGASRKIANLERVSVEDRRAHLLAHMKNALSPILGVEENAISPTRSLVDLGLDSLMALEFRNRVRADLGITVPTVKLLQGPSLERLVEEVMVQLGELAADKPPVKSSEEVIEYALSSGQQAQWFGHKFTPDSRTFNIGFTASVSPRVDWECFQCAVAGLVNRHPAFRTIIVEVEPGRPMQRVLASVEPDVMLVDAVTWTEEELRQRALEEFKADFALDRPMMRIRVFRRANNCDVFLFSVDHLIVDASSLIICFEDLKAFYDAEVLQTDLKLEPLTADYSDFVKWETTMKEGPESDRLWKYWSQKLSGTLPVLNLPSLRTRPEVLMPKGESVGVVFGAELSTAVLRLAKERRVTSYAILLSGYLMLLKMYSRQDDIIVGTSVSQRQEEEWSRVIGLFVNILPLRIDFHGDPSFPEFLARVREAILGGLEHHEFPFPTLVNRLPLSRTMRHSPVFQAFLNFLQDRDGDFGGLVTPGGSTTIPFGSSTLTPFMVIPQEDGRSEIALHIGQKEFEFAGNLNYNGNVLDRSTAESMASNYIGIMESIVGNPERRISELLWCAERPEEREELIL